MEIEGGHDVDQLNLKITRDVDVTSNGGEGK